MDGRRRGRNPGWRVMTSPQRHDRIFGRRGEWRKVILHEDLHERRHRRSNIHQSAGRISWRTTQMGSGSVNKRTPSRSRCSRNHGSVIQVLPS